jgi:hypothetical protein
LTEGNVSTQDAKVGGLYIYNPNTPSGNGYVYITGDKNRFNFYSNTGVDYGYLTQNFIRLEDSANNYGFSISKPTTLTGNYVATFQNATGTVAYISDIPTDYIINVFSNSDEISVTSNDGEIELTYNEQKDVVLLKTYLINTLTNTTYYEDGGLFFFDEIEEPINALKLSFEEDIVVDSTDNFGYVAFHYNNGMNAIYTIPLTGHSVSGTDLTVRLPLVEYWNVDLSYFSIHLLVGCVSSGTSGRSFKGLTPSAITNYYNFSSLIV